MIRLTVRRIRSWMSKADVYLNSWYSRQWSHSTRINFSKYIPNDNLKYHLEKKISQQVFMKMKVIHMTSVTSVFEIIVTFIQFFLEKMDESLKQWKELPLNQNTKWRHFPAPEPSNFKKFIPLVIRDTNQPCAPRPSRVLRTAHSCSNLQTAPDLRVRNPGLTLWLGYWLQVIHGNLVSVSSSVRGITPQASPERWKERLK